MHIEFLVEEQSAAAALEIIVPRIVGNEGRWEIRAYNGKMDLLRKLPSRLKGYSRWLPQDHKIVVLVDADQQDCRVLKQRLETYAHESGLRTRSTAGSQGIQVINRIAVEELEAWFFGDVQALRAAYPRVPQHLDQQSEFRNPDRIGGGTWEALERVLQAAGYQRGGLAKIETARSVARHMDPRANRSNSFRAFRDALLGIMG